MLSCLISDQQIAEQLCILSVHDTVLIGVGIGECRAGKCAGMQKMLLADGQIFRIEDPVTVCIAGQCRCRTGRCDNDCVVDAVGGLSVFAECDGFTRSIVLLVDIV